MPSKNSFVSFLNNMEILNNNSLQVLTSLNKTVSATDSDISITVVDANGNNQIVSMPTIGYLKSQIDIINQNMRSISSVDARGTVIQTVEGDKRLFTKNINKEPNIIPELASITNFISQKNLFFDSLMNPLMKIRLDLTNKIQTDIRKVISRRYIINFQTDQFGVTTTLGNSAITAFNQLFKNRTNITIDELETWLKNTPGIDTDNRGSKIIYDEEYVDLDYYNIQYKGFYTILGTDIDTVNRKMYFQIDTLDYYEISTGQKKQLNVNDELIINTAIASTLYKIVEVNTSASNLRIRMELVEGYEPIPVSVTAGMKFYSPIINSQVVDVSIGFNEYNVVFLKAVDTDNHIVSRDFSTGVAYYTNDLLLSSTDSSGDNNKSMSQFYVETVQDFGDLLKDFVNRYIPREKGVKPNAPTLVDSNFRVVQSNTYLTNTTTIAEQRELNQQINTLSSKISETSKLIKNKYDQLYTKNFKTQKDKDDVNNQILKLNGDLSSFSTLKQSAVNQLLASSNNNNAVDASFEVQGFWQMVAGVENGFTRKQEPIAYYVEYKYSNTDGKETQNETFKVTESDGTLVNAVFSPWKPYWSPLRRRLWDIASQTYIWEIQDLANIDIPNINSISLPLAPNEQITIRVKTVSEVGYPDSILESDFSNELTISFPTNLLQPRSPQEIFQKNAELENLRNSIETDFDAKGLTKHLSDGVTFQNKVYAHGTDTIYSVDVNGKIISLTDKIIQLTNATPVMTPLDIVLSGSWVNFGAGYASAKYYLDRGQINLSGTIKIDRGDKYPNFSDRFPEVDIIAYGSSPQNTSYVQIGQLPTGYRPTNGTVRLSVVCNGGNGVVKMGALEINNLGIMSLIYGNTGNISLDGLSFRIV